MSDTRIAWPRMVVALDRAGGVPRRPGRPHERAAEDLGAIGHYLVWLEGHGAHGGWTWDPATRVLSCECGPLFEFCDVMTGEKQ